MSISRVAVTGVIMGTVLIGISPVASAAPSRVTVSPNPVAANHRITVETDACAPGTVHARAYSHAFRPVSLRPVSGTPLVAGAGRIAANVGTGAYRVIVVCQPDGGPTRIVSGTVTIRSDRHEGKG